MKKLIYLIFIFSLINAAERQALRALYKDDLHTWLALPPTQSNICGICLQNEGSIKSLACDKRHLFHPACIQRWRNEESTCPICRAVIVDSIWCTCLKSLGNPAVILCLVAAGASCVTSFERIDEYLQLIKYAAPTLESHCVACAGLAVSGGCAICFGYAIRSKLSKND